MDFIAPEPAPVQDITISSTPFFPAVSLKRYREEMRQDGTVKDERLKPAIAYAIVEANRELHRWSLAQQARGYTALANIPADQVNGESELIALYYRAVFCLTKASLTERYRDINTTASGNKKAEAMEPAIDDYWRDAQWALQRLQGQTHTIVELI